MKIPRNVTKFRTMFIIELLTAAWQGPWAGFSFNCSLLSSSSEYVLSSRQTIIFMTVLSRNF